MLLNGIIINPNNVTLVRPQPPVAGFKKRSFKISFTGGDWEVFEFDDEGKMRAAFYAVRMAIEGGPPPMVPLRNWKEEGLDQ
jgi:hypothetical protein